MSSSARVLFILKHRTLESPYSTGDYNCVSERPLRPVEDEGEDGTSDGDYTKELSSGLSLSVEFCVQMLNKLGIWSKAVQVVDNNCIDREVHLHKPTHVVIEALWVVPSKFIILHKLHPTVQWIVRIHSEVPFLANEGVAVDWIIHAAAHPMVSIAANSMAARRDVRQMLDVAFPSWTKEKLDSKIVYLPNYYMLDEMEKWVAWAKKRPPKGKQEIRLRDEVGTILNVGCFGSIRPLKNNLIQAVAALRFAEREHVKLHFHINSERTEGGANILKNMRALFDGTQHQLIEHRWLEHLPFLRILTWMDISLCVSLSETFCLVAADSIAAGVPTVVSRQIKWASQFAVADPSNSFSIERTMRRALNPTYHNLGLWLNNKALRRYCRRAESVWRNYFKPRRVRANRTLAADAK